MEMDYSSHMPSTKQLKPPQASTLSEVVERIHEAFSADEVDVDYVTEVLETYKSNPVEWRKFAKFDRYKYTRNLVDEGNGKFNLMLVCWGPSQQSTIHDHADAHCFMKLLAGSLTETRFEFPEEEGNALTVIGNSTLETEQVCYINDSLGLHQVSNTSDSDPAVSLHLYCPPFSSCKIFDEQTGRPMKCPVTFYSKFGHKIRHSKH